SFLVFHYYRLITCQVGESPIFVPSLILKLYFFMKRIFLGLTVFLFLLIATVYAFIPGKLTVSSASSFKANQESVYRFLINDSNWQKWWPGTVSKSSRGSLLFRYKDYDFQ